MVTQVDQRILCSLVLMASIHLLAVHAHVAAVQRSFNNFNQGVPP